MIEHVGQITQAQYEEIEAGVGGVNMTHSQREGVTWPVGVVSLPGPPF